MELKKLIENTITEYLNEKMILNEVEIPKYTIEKRSENEYIGYFKANNLKYSVDIYHNDKKHRFGVWEVEFSVENQTNAGHRTKKDLKHLNIVLYTVFEIVQNVVNKIGIKKIYIDSANDEFDENIFNTTRSDLYYRFLKNKFDTAKIDKQGRFIMVSFSDEGNKKLDIVKDILINISDNYIDLDGLNRGINGTDDNNFQITTDFISNINVGDIYIEINVDEKNNEFYVEYEILDTGFTESYNAKSFFELINYLKKLKIKFENM